MLRPLKPNNANRSLIAMFSTMQWKTPPTAMSSVRKIRPRRSWARSRSAASACRPAYVDEGPSAGFAVDAVDTAADARAALPLIAYRVVFRTEHCTSSPSSTRRAPRSACANTSGRSNRGASKRTHPDIFRRSREISRHLPSCTSTGDFGTVEGKDLTNKIQGACENDSR